MGNIWSICENNNNNDKDINIKKNRIHQQPKQWFTLTPTGFAEINPPDDINLTVNSK